MDQKSWVEVALRYKPSKEYLNPGQNMTLDGWRRWGWCMLLWKHNRVLVQYRWLTLIFNMMASGCWSRRWWLFSTRIWVILNKDDYYISIFTCCNTNGFLMDWRRWRWRQFYWRSTKILIWLIIVLVWLMLHRRWWCQGVLLWWNMTHMVLGQQHLGGFSAWQGNKRTNFFQWSTGNKFFNSLITVVNMSL